MKLREIPHMTRWLIASHVLTRTVVELGSRTVGQDYTEDSDRVFTVLAQEIRALAERLGMPRGHAAELVSTLGSLSVILFGPEFETRFIEGDPEEGVIRLIACAMFREESAHGVPSRVVNRVCTAYVQHAVEALNPDYTIHVTRARCRGDGFCEMIVARRGAEVHHR